MKHFKNFKLIGALIPIAIIVATIGSLFFVFSKSSSKKDLNKVDDPKINPHDIYKNSDFFPSLNKYQFYDDLRISKNNALINQTMIAKIINYVLDKMNVNNQPIWYGYKQVTPWHIFVQFKIMIENKPMIQTYKFSII